MLILGIFVDLSTTFSGLYLIMFCRFFIGATIQPVNESCCTVSYYRTVLRAEKIETLITGLFDVKR